MEDWKKNPAFIGGTNFEEREVNGEMLRFHPISAGLMFRLRRLAVPIARALSTLSQKHTTDTTVVNRQFEDDGDGGRGAEVINEALSPQLAKLRTQQRADAMQELVEAVTDESNKLLVGQVIIDSLRDSVPRDAAKKTAEIQEFMDSLDLTTLVSLLKGVASANSEVLGPLEDQVRGIVVPRTKEMLPGEDEEETIPETDG